MASCWSNVLTILLFATVTFIVLDVNRHDNFNRTLTARYLRTIGAKSIADKAISSISSSTIYKEYLNPQWLAFVRSVRKYAKVAFADAQKYVQLVAVKLRTYSTSLLEYLDQTVFPSVSKYTGQYYNLISKYATKYCNVVKEYLLIFADWFNSNVYSGLNTEGVSKVLNNVVTQTQKAAFDSYKWVQGQVGKLVA